MIKSWVNDVNTTSFRIVASVWGAVVNITALTVAILVFKWEPTAMQLRVLTGEATVLLTMMGFDVLQFVGKRFSDAEYQRAKNPSTPPDEPAPTSATDGPPPVDFPTKLPPVLLRPPKEASD